MLKRAQCCTATAGQPHRSTCSCPLEHDERRATLGIPLDAAAASMRTHAYRAGIFMDGGQVSGERGAEVLAEYLAFRRDSSSS